MFVNILVCITPCGHQVFLAVHPCITGENCWIVSERLKEKDAFLQYDLFLRFGGGHWRQAISALLKSGHDEREIAAQGTERLFGLEEK
jgi:hypothetical protein